MTRVEYVVQGLDELIEDIRRLEAQAEPVFEEMLDAGAEIVVEEWKKSAEKFRHRDTGDMIDSISATKQQSRLRGMRNSHIQPRGSDRKGMRNANKAYWRHYGTSQRAATYWTEYATVEADKRVPEKLTIIWGDYLKGRK